MGFLSSYKPPSKTVTLKTADGEQQCVVRGITAAEVSHLIHAQGDEVREFFNRAVEGKIDAANMAAAVQMMMDEAPLMLGLVIAFGCGEPEFSTAALEMPLCDQVAIVEAIVGLTFYREGGAKKVMEIIARAAKEAGTTTRPAT